MFIPRCRGRDSNPSGFGGISRNSPFFIFGQFPKLKADAYEEYAQEVISWKRRRDFSLSNMLRDLQVAARHIEKQSGPEDVGLKVCQAQIRLIEGMLEGQL